MQKISTCLWFDGKAEEAAKFYTSIFKNSKILGISRYDKDSSEASGQKEGAVMTVMFEIEGREFMGLNGGPIFKFNESVSFMIDCKDQEEVDYYWDNLIADGGKPSECGWLKDKYGLSWQVVPSILNELIGGKDTKKGRAAMKAMLTMSKMDVAKLQKAYDEA